MARTFRTPYPATWVEVKGKDQADHPSEPGFAIDHQPPSAHQLIRSVAFADPRLWVRREGDVQDAGILEHWKPKAVFSRDLAA